MPYPILLAAGAALSAAGAGAGMVASNQAKSAMNEKVKAELFRQKGFQQKSDDLYNRSLTQSTPDVAKDQMQQGEDAAMGEYKKLQDIPLSTGAAQFQDNKATSIVQDQGRTQNQNKSQARLQGYSEWDLQQAIKNMNVGARLNLVSGQARSSANVMPYEVQQASHAGDTLAGIGQMLGVAGSVVGMGGALGLGSAASGAANAGANASGAVAGTAANGFAPLVSAPVSQALNPWYIPTWSAGLANSGAYFQ